MKITIEIPDEMRCLCISGVKALTVFLLFAHFSAPPSFGGSGRSCQ